MFLFDLGAKKLIKTEDKIEYIKYKDLLIYDTDFINDLHHMPNLDIFKDMEYINNILECDYHEYQSNVDNFMLSKVYGSDWLCDSGRMVDNPQEVFMTWLDRYRIIFNLYDRYSNDLTTGKAYSNFIRMKTYIINTEYIIDTILEYIRSKDRDLLRK